MPAAINVSGNGAMALSNQCQQAVCFSQFRSKTIAIRIGMAADKCTYEPGIKPVVDGTIGYVRNAWQKIGVDKDAGLLGAEIIQARTANRPTDPSRCW